VATAARKDVNVFRGNDVWSTRAQAFRDSPTHRAGPDLELLVGLCEPGDGVTALDVATGGGHVARRLREEGCTVVTVDPAPGMQPDVVARAEDLPFADRSFDVVACRIAPHHFADIRKAVAEMARVSHRLVVIEDNLFVGERAEEAERLRDPTHVRRYSEEEWKEMLTQAGLEVERSEVLERHPDVEEWLARVETPPADAQRVKELLADRIVDGKINLPTIVIKARHPQS
jgi:SAM-dependent methyltransferase